MKGNLQITITVTAQKSNVVCRYVPIAQRHTPPYLPPRNPKMKILMMLFSTK